MAYVGNQPSGNFVQVTSQTITGNGGSTYTPTDQPVTPLNLRHSSTTSDKTQLHSVTGTSLTLAATSLH